MRVESNASFIQQIQARQAFAARPAAPAEAPPAAAPEVASRPEWLPPQPGMKSLPVREIQQVAAKAGFVGLSEAEIQRAYLRGESLLTDYRV